MLMDALDGNFATDACKEAGQAAVVLFTLLLSRHDEDPGIAKKAGAVLLELQAVPCLCKLLAAELPSWFKNRESSYNAKELGKSKLPDSISDAGMHS